MEREPEKRLDYRHFQPSSSQDPRDRIPKRRAMEVPWDGNPKNPFEHSEKNALVPVIFRLKGSLLRDIDVVGLLGGQLR